MTEDAVIRAVNSYGIALVEITGGEPLMQKETLLLTERLLDGGFTVLIETNGSMSVKNIDKRAVIIMDIKTPKSGMFEKMDLTNLKYIKPGDELKFVVQDRGDYDWAKKFMEDYGIKGKRKILLSPAFGVLAPEKLAAWIVEDRLPVRLNLQVHKYIYGPDRTGV